MTYYTFIHLLGCGQIISPFVNWLTVLLSLSFSLSCSPVIINLLSGEWLARIFFHSVACLFTELPIDGFPEPCKNCMFIHGLFSPATIPVLTMVPPSTWGPKQGTCSPFLPGFSPSPSPWDLPTPHLEYLPTIQSDAFFLPAQKRINILLYRALIWAATGVSCVLAEANHCLSLNPALALRVEPKALNAILGMLYHVTHDPPLSSSFLTLPSLQVSQRLLGAHVESPKIMPPRSSSFSVFFLHCTYHHVMV